VIGFIIQKKEYNLGLQPKNAYTALHKHRISIAIATSWWSKRSFVESDRYLLAVNDSQSQLSSHHWRLCRN